MTTRTLSRLLRPLSLGGVALFAVVVIGLHVLKSDFDPLRQMISEYANGPHAWLMTAAFCVLALGSAALAARVFTGPEGLPWRIARTIPLAAWALALMALAYWPADLSGSAASATGRLHGQAATLGFLSLEIAVLLSLLADGFRRPRALGALVLGGSFLAASLGLMLALGGAPADRGGLVQRCYVACLLGWLAWRSARAAA